MQIKTLRMKMWQGIQAKTMRGILRKCHWHARHLASLGGDLKDLGPIGHFRNPPAPVKGMALSRKVEGSVFELGQMPPGGDSDPSLVSLALRAFLWLGWQRGTGSAWHLKGKPVRRVVRALGTCEWPMKTGHLCFASL